MVFARRFILTALLVIGWCAVAGASAPESGIDGNGYRDDYFGIEYPSEGLSGELAITGNPHLLMRGRTADGVEIEILVNEIPGGAKKVDFIRVAKSQFDAQDPAPKVVAEGKKPQPWMITEFTGDDGTLTNTGIAYYDRGDMVFIVRAWVPGETMAANDRIEAAIGRLETERRKGVFLAAHVVTRGTDEDPRSAHNLAKAAALYSKQSPISSYALAIEAAEAANKAGRKTLEDNEKWQVNFVLGLAQLKLGKYEDAAFTWKRCVRIAESTPELSSELPGSHYNLAATYALLGRLDGAFRELETALELEEKAGATKLRDLARSDADLANLHADPRWRKRFGTS